MEKIIKEAVTLLGLGAKEASFFTATFYLGPATIQDIAKKARLERSTAYLIASELVAKGLIIEDFRNYRRTYVTVEPKTLLRMVYAQERRIGRKGLEIEEHLAQLQTVYAASEVRPRVRVYEGKNGLNEVKTDILSLPQEILLWTNQETEGLVFSPGDHDRFIKERIGKNISIRVLAIDNRKGHELKKTDSSSARQTKLLPNAVYFSTETYVYGNKMATLDYKKDIIGIVIESEPIVASQRAVFEMTWGSIID